MSKLLPSPSVEFWCNCQGGYVRKLLHSGYTVGSWRWGEPDDECPASENSAMAVSLPQPKEILLLLKVLVYVTTTSYWY